MSHPRGVAVSLTHALSVRTRGLGRAIVYIHGLGESGLCFDELASQPELAGFRHVIVDLPGYGRSPWPAVAPSLVELAEVVASGLAQWRGDERAPIVVGHSMGGVIGTILCERHPDAVGALVNIEGNVTRGDCTASAVAARQSLDDFVAGGFDTLRDTTYAEGVRDVAKRGYYAAMRFADPRSFHRHARELVAVSDDESMAARLAAIAARVPLVYVAGVPGGAAARTLAVLAERAIATVRVEPAGHWPFIDRPDVVANAIRSLA